MTTTLPTTSLTGTYRIDPDHSSAAFAVRHMGVSMFRGSFAGMAGTVTAGDSVRIAGAVPVAGISVKSPVDLRTHLLSEEFFAADLHPEIRFSGDHVALRADGSAVVAGDLTIRNVTRGVVASGTWSPAVEDPFGATRAAIELATTIDRRDFGMTWNLPLPKGGDALGNDVEITVHLELVAD